MFEPHEPDMSLDGFTKFLIALLVISFLVGLWWARAEGFIIDNPQI